MNLCLQCGEEIKGQGKKYCSIKCVGQSQRTGGWKGHAKTCTVCGTDFNTRYRNQDKCSRSCSAKANNAGRVRHGTPWPKCKGCDSKANPTGNGYCTTECRQSHEITLWLAGELDGCLKYTHAKYVRRHLDKKTGGQCEECGYNKTRPDGSSILQVDHIDGNWQNNRPENVRLLCPNCHALTPTWGAGNMGNGRTWKKDYSQFGV